MTKAIAETPKSQLPAAPTHAPRGLEQGSPEDMILPHVLLTQPTSKLVTQKDFKAGVCINSLTEQIYEGVVEFVPILYRHFYNVFRFEKQPDGKAKKIFDFRTDDKNDKRLAGKRWKGDDNGKREIEPVMRFMSLVNHQPAVIDFTKSSIQGGKKLYTLASLARTDLFSNVYRLKINKETNDQGTFFVKDVEPIGPAGAEEYKMCEELHEAFGGPKAPKVSEAIEEVPF